VEHQTAVVTAAEAALRAWHGDRCQLLGVILVAASPGGGPAFEIPLGTTRPLAREAAPRGPTLRERIVAVLEAAGKPLKGPAVARRCGVEPTGYFRSTIAAMVTRGTVAHGKLGYFLPTPGGTGGPPL
jgi:hypothetical protein